MYRRLWVGVLIFGIIFSYATLGRAQSYSPKIGEVLQYKIIVKSMIHGADQTVRVIGKEVYQNNEVFRIQYTMSSMGLVNKLYKYSESEEVLLDADGLYPVFLKKKVSEKGSLETEEVQFDYNQGIAIRTLVENGGAPQRTEIKLPGHVYNALALQFFLRKKPLDSRSSKLYFYSNGKIKEVVYKVGHITANPITLDCGTYSNYTQIESEDITIMLAANHDKVPLVIRKMANFGKVEARLVSFTQ